MKRRELNRRELSRRGRDRGPIDLRPGARLGTGRAGRGLGVAGVALVAALAAYVAVRNVRASRPEQAPAPLARPVESERAAPGAREEKGAERVAGIPAGRLLPYRIFPPVRIDDGLTFGPADALRTRLAGLEGPSRDAVCFDPAGLLWACGLQARSALARLTAGRALACVPTRPPEDAVTAACSLDGQDLGRQLVELGFARPLPGGDRAAADAARAAQAAGRGLWNGGWRIRP